MIVEIKIPTPGESITEVEISQWFVSTGDYVEKDQELGEIESDKATLPLLADNNGIITILVEAGIPVAVGTVACTINSDAPPPADNKGKVATKVKQAVDTIQEKTEDEKVKIETAVKSPSGNKPYSDIKISPVAREMMKKHSLSAEDIISGLTRIGKREIELLLTGNDFSALASPDNKIPSREESRTKLSSLRKKISARLVAVKNETAMLTTFNEVDMTEVIEMRKQYQKQFVEKHGIKLGFMSFFTKAAIEALKLYPMVNSYIDIEEIVSPAYYDIGIAVQADKGLMVPVLRNAETMTLAEIEKNIALLAEKARKNRISLDDLTGGTFTVTNGGVFGSLMSTPILNPPQSGILGMHNIVERPVAIAGKVEIRPMMYIALSYDHRVIDGRDSVGFLVKVKGFIENPYKMLLKGKEPNKILLDL